MTVNYLNYFSHEQKSQCDIGKDNLKRSYTLFLNIKKLSMTAKQIEKIINTCLKYQIENYSINPDGSIDVDENVKLQEMELSELPLIFNKVSGNFNCFRNKLTSLVGSPKHVAGDFYCYDNPLVSLVGCPETIMGSCYISGTPIQNLVGCPSYVGGTFSFNVSMHSTFSGDTDLEIYDDIYLNISDDIDTTIRENYISETRLPWEFIENIQHLKLILKYQRYFEIWNNDLTLNIENFQVLIAEIKDGLL